MINLVIGMALGMALYKLYEAAKMQYKYAKVKNTVVDLAKIMSDKDG